MKKILMPYSPFKIHLDLKYVLILQTAQKVSSSLPFDTSAVQQTETRYNDVLCIALI